MILEDDKITEGFPKMLESSVNFGDIKKGEQVLSFKLTETPKGSCDYHKVVQYGSDKVHYLYTHEVSE